MSFKQLLRFPTLLNLAALIAISAFAPAPLQHTLSLLSRSSSGSGTASVPPANLQSSNSRPPLILIPGMTGSRMENDPDGNGSYGEVWPNGDRLIFDPWDQTLLALKLASNGADPFGPELGYTTVQVGDIIRTEYFLDYYGSTINYFLQEGYTEGKDFFACPYDWRKDIQEIAFGPLAQTLDKCIDRALSNNPGATRVNILAHSLGGLVARAYLTEPTKAQKVQRLVTLGSPFLGVPEILLAILDQLCFAEWLGLCFTNTEVLHELIQNYPAGYQVAPGEGYFQVYPQGYYRRDRDADGDGRRDGYLDAGSVYGLLGEQNQELAHKAQAFYTHVGGWNNGGTNGVEVFMIVGDGHASMGTIIEYETRPWYDPWGLPTIAYRSEPVNGDGTVPLGSADLRNRARGVDLTAGVKVFYYNLDHSALPRDPAVLQLAAQIFNGKALLDAEARAPLQPFSGSNSAQTNGPRTEPLPLNGVWLTVDGPVEVEVEDGAGNRIGSPEKSSVQSPEIPGASMTQMGTTVFLFLPQSQRYEIHLRGQQEGAADLRIEQIAGDQIYQTILFEDLPVTSKSGAVLLLDNTSASIPEISLDQDGDGIVEAAFPPAAVLNVDESRDTTPPVTLITVQGSLLPGGRYAGPVSVTLTAEDNPGGAGVAVIEYSLDGGKTVKIYSGPFQADPDVAPLILARARDRAGNEETPLSSARLVPLQIFLPALVR